MILIFYNPNLSHAEKFGSCILRLSIYSIGYITFSGLYLFSTAGHGSTVNFGGQQELNVFLSLVDSICVLILVLLSGIWTASSGKTSDSNKPHGSSDFSEPLMFSGQYQPPAPPQTGPVAGHHQHQHHPAQISHHHMYIPKTQQNNCEQPTQLQQNTNMPLAHSHPHPAFAQNQPQIFVQSYPAPPVMMNHLISQSQTAQSSTLLSSENSQQKADIHPQNMRHFVISDPVNSTMSDRSEHPPQLLRTGGLVTHGHMI